MDELDERRPSRRATSHGEVTPAECLLENAARRRQLSALAALVRRFRGSTDSD